METAQENSKILINTKLVISKMKNFFESFTSTIAHCKALRCTAKAHIAKRKCRALCATCANTALYCTAQGTHREVTRVLRRSRAKAR